MTETYYIRIHNDNKNDFEIYLYRNAIVTTHISSDWIRVPVTHFYSIEATTEEMLTIKLSFPLIGSMKFDKPFGRHVKPSIV